MRLRLARHSARGPSITSSLGASGGAPERQDRGSLLSYTSKGADRVTPANSRAEQPLGPQESQLSRELIRPGPRALLRRGALWSISRYTGTGELPAHGFAMAPTLMPRRMPRARPLCLCFVGRSREYVVLEFRLISVDSDF